MRRCLALLFLTFLFAPAAHANPNLLRNASFERGSFAGWSFFGAGQGGRQTTPGVAREGAGYGIAQTPVPDSFYQDASIAVPVANRSYNASLWVRSASGRPFEGTLFVLGAGEQATSSFTATDTWQLVTATLSAAPAVSSLRFQVQLRTPGEQLLVDGAQLIDARLQNASFETTAGWSGWESSLHSVAVPSRDGARSGLMTAAVSSGAIMQDHAIQPDTGAPYTFSLWVRSVSGAPVRGAVAIWGLPNTEGASTHFTAGPEWQLVTTTLQPTLGNTTVRSQVYLYDPGLGVYLDGAQLSAAGFTNPSFEQPFLRGWDAFPRGPFTAATSQPGSAMDGRGSAIVRTDAPGRSFAQNLGVKTEGGNSSTVSVWVRSPSPGGAAGSLVLTGAGGESGATPFHAGWDWTYVSAPLNPEQTQNTLSAEVVLDTPGAELQVDGASYASGNAREGVARVPAAPGPPAPPAPPAPADSDGDGMADASDVCPKLKGGAIRRGCPLGLTNDTSISYVRTRRGIRVVRYYVEATKGARVVVTCSKGCRKTVLKGKGPRRVQITRLRGRALRNGARITVTVSQPGRLTATVVDRVAKRRRVAGRRVCVQPGTTKPTITC